ncbi:MAG: DUF1501 domain-containing protein [Verrucomicrobiota bacterium]
MNDVLKTRRQFLRTSALGAATSATLPLFLERTMGQLHEEAETYPQKAGHGKDDTILVVLQLAGGNDGLNTLVPFGDDAYHKARPRLALDKDEVLPLNDYLGLNSSLPSMHAAYDEGNLAVIQGVGYPNPNRSHFRSTEIWQTATDADGVSPTGWLGRYFDHACQGAEPDPTTGISITNKQPQSFMAKKNPGISVSQPELYRWIQGRDADEMAEDFFRELNRPEEEGMAESGSSIGELTGKQQSAESNLDFLERTALDAQVSSDTIIKLSKKGGKRGRYPGTRLGKSLGLVSKMIAGGLATRVYYVNHGGFDTHNNQANSHARLLREMDEALGTFMKDCGSGGTGYVI